MTLLLRWTLVLCLLNPVYSFAEETDTYNFTVQESKSIKSKSSQEESKSSETPVKEDKLTALEVNQDANLKTNSSNLNSQVEMAVPQDLSPHTEEKKINSENKIIHNLIRRIVVFPIETNNLYKKEADLAWWKMRDTLSKYQRFLVATKRFLTQKEVFQSRSELKISDVILLSQILESDVVITSFIEKNQLTMNAYSSQDGLLLWKKSASFNSGKPISQQLEVLAEKLIQDFIAHIPYHGFLVADTIQNKPYQEEGSALVVKVDVGAESTIQPNEKIQWIEIERTNTQALFMGGAKYNVYAEGAVISNENQILTVELKRYLSLDKIANRNLILSPDEFKRLKSKFEIRDSSLPEVPLNLVQGELRNVKDKKSEKTALITALVSILNIVIVALLAF